METEELLRCLGGGGGGGGAGAQTAPEVSLTCDFDG